MLDERSEDEPDGPDLSSRIPGIDFDGVDPDLGPDIPDARPSNEGFLGPEDASDELIRAFWSLVVLIDVGLLAVTLGILVVVFQGRLYLGGGLLAVGLLALARGGYRYYRFDRESFADGEGEND